MIGTLRISKKKYVYSHVVICILYILITKKIFRISTDSILDYRTIQYKMMNGYGETEHLITLQWKRPDIVLRTRDEQIMAAGIFMLLIAMTVVILQFQCVK